MALSKEDLRLLKAVLDAGHRLEKLWPQTPESGAELSPQSSDALNLLLSSIRNLKASAASDLSRLAENERLFTPQMSAKHLASSLVPFERLLGRSLRDDEFLVQENDKREVPVERGPLVVIADNLRSAFNVGAILRTSECFGAQSVWLTGYTPTPEDEKTSKTSMGAENLISWQSCKKASEAIERLKADGYTVIALETALNATSLENFEWPEKPALLLGNERFGLDHDLLAKADQIVRIPLYGQKNSLNVGIAFGIVCADWRSKKQRADASPKPVSFSPIGVFRTSAVHPYEARRQGSLNGEEQIGIIELQRGSQFEQALDGLEGMQRIWLVYQFHHNTAWKPMVMPPRGPRVKRGVFATRSPYRPNPIGISCVELLEVDGLQIKVRGFDLLDETPILDIKPYLPYADSFPDAQTGWIAELDSDAYAVEFTEHATRQLRWLEQKGVQQFRGFLVSQLEFDPLDIERKRLVLGVDKDGPHRIAYRTWRAEFLLDQKNKSILVEEVFSGYSGDDLALTEDPYGDKAIHREFVQASWVN